MWIACSLALTWPASSRSDVVVSAFPARESCLVLPCPFNDCCCCCCAAGSWLEPEGDKDVVAIQLVEVQAERDRVVMDLPSGSTGSGVGTGAGSAGRAEAKAAAADRVVDLTQGLAAAPAAAASSKAAAAGSAGAAGEATKERKQHDEDSLPIAERIAFRVVWTVSACASDWPQLNTVLIVVLLVVQSLAVFAARFTPDPDWSGISAMEARELSASTSKKKR